MDINNIINNTCCVVGGILILTLSIVLTIAILNRLTPHKGCKCAVEYSIWESDGNSGYIPTQTTVLSNKDLTRKKEYVYIANGMYRITIQLIDTNGRKQ